MKIYYRFIILKKKRNNFLYLLYFFLQNQKKINYYLLSIFFISLLIGFILHFPKIILTNYNMLIISIFIKLSITPLAL